MKILQKFLCHLQEFLHHLQIVLPWRQLRGWEMVQTYNIIPGRIGNICDYCHRRVSVPKIGFFFVGKNLLLHVVMMKKVAHRGFLAFWPYEQKFRRKRKNTAKNLKFGKK